jgi:hypothetical protein
MTWTTRRASRGAWSPGSRHSRRPPTTTWRRFTPTACASPREAVGLLGRLRVSGAAKLHRDDKHSRAALTRLAVWDGVMDKDQVAPAIYAPLRERLTQTDAS